MEDTNLTVMLQEVGHALGVVDADAGPVQTLEEFDVRAFTVMSDNGGPLSELGVFDEVAIQELYGEPYFFEDDSGGLLEFVVDEAALTTSQIWGDHASQSRARKGALTHIRFYSLVGASPVVLEPMAHHW